LFTNLGMQGCANRRQVSSCLQWKEVACCGKRVRKVEDSYVGVVHHVSDPEGFKAAEQKSLEEGLPEGISLPIHATTSDYTTVMCIWEGGESVEAVKDLVESVVGEYSENEYFEMAKVEGLPAS
jgi:hypothetical protein